MFQHFAPSTDRWKNCPESFMVTQTRAIEILTILQKRHGKAYKINIRQAWHTGDYSTFPELAQELQWIRNARYFGPKWLNRTKGQLNVNYGNQRRVPKQVS